MDTETERGGQDKVQRKQKDRWLLFDGREARSTIKITDLENALPKK